MRIRFLELRDDIYDCATVSYSSDNGQTWSDPEPWTVSWKVDGGMKRRLYQSGFVDPVQDRLLLTADEGLLPTDTAIDGLSAYYPVYRVSKDGGRTWQVDEPMIQAEGADQYDAAHPFDDFWVGRNALMLVTNKIRNAEGDLLVPAQMSVLDAEGRLFCPPGAYTFTEALLLIGTWRADGRLDWRPSQRVSLAPERSTRGAVEPTIAQMPDGRILMVLRGSNVTRPDLPGRKWFCVSHDQGRTWDEPRPWGYDDGTLFYSPSSISLLVPHSNGKHYWFGNICPQNPVGNGPRYPLVAAEVDPQGLQLIRESVVEIDTRREGDPEQLALSNFGVYEDRRTGELVLHMTRLTFQETDGGSVPGGDVHAYRIEP